MRAGQGAAAPEEIELKYLVDDDSAAQRWLDEAFPRRPGERWRSFAIVDRYFDTADGRLAAAGYGVRLRRSQGRTMLTVKADIEVRGGRHRRIELEAPARATLSLARWPHSEARSHVERVVGDALLIERFVVRMRRRERLVEVEGSLLALSVDDARVEWNGAAVGGLRQVEFELRRGDATVLDGVAQRVAHEGDGLLRPEGRSKVAIALELVEVAARVAVDDPLAEAGRKVLRRHLLRMLEREIALRRGDAEALKQMRVATRRMRTVWRVFGSAFRRADERRYVAELRRVATTLGAVRDLDVLLARLPATATVAPLAATWRAERDTRWAELLALLDGAEYRRFVRDYLALTGERGAAVPRRRPQPVVGEAAPTLVGAAVARLETAAAAVTAGGADSDAARDLMWHDLRIRGKRLRYTLEALREVLDERATTTAIEALRSLQDILGEMNDAAVAARAAQDWLGENATAPARSRTAIRRFIADARRRVEAQRSLFATDWPAAHAIIAGLPSAQPESLTNR